MSAFLLTFRETLEAAIIVGLIFGILNMFSVGKKEKMFVVGGVVLGVLVSIAFAFILEWIFGEFEGKIEKIFEGTLMLVAAGLITHFVLWTHKHFSHLGKKLTHGIKKALDGGHLYMLTFLALVSVIREGVETVIFLKSSDALETSATFFHAILGVFTAIIVALGVFFYFKKVNMKKVLQSTNVLFLLLGAGLLSHAISEFEGAGLIPKIMKPLFDLNDTFLTEKNGLGATLKAAISYDADPSLIAFGTYVLYILIVGYIIFFQKKKA